MGQTGRDRRPSDPLSVMAAGMRQMSRLDLDDVKQAMAHLTDPDSVNFLDMLGRTREERVERMATMLRNSSEADMEEMGVVFSLAMAKIEARPATAKPRRRDPVAMWADGLRRMGSFDLRAAWRGFENFAQPSAAGMLASLGRTRREQVEKMTGLLRTMSPEDMDEMGTIYGLAFARAVGDRKPSTETAESGRRSERPRKPRGLTAAEWRQARR